MPRRTGPDPLAVIKATLSRNPYDDFDTKAIKVVADLAGHGLVITHQPTASVVQRCGREIDGHPGTALVSNHCPICGWSPTS